MAVRIVGGLHRAKALRDLKEDIQYLVEYFFLRYCQENEKFLNSEGRSWLSFEPEAMQMLMAQLRGESPQATLLRRRDRCVRRPEPLGRPRLDLAEDDDRIAAHDEVDPFESKRAAVVTKGK